MNEFLNKEKTQINLPVPLGSKVYRIFTKCSDVCTFQKELTEKNRELIKCNIQAICHTISQKPREFELTFDNLGWILNEWNSTVFATEEEASSTGEKMINNHIKDIKKLGFKLQENGYSYIPH